MSKEAQILTCIRNISPYLSNKITAKDYKSTNKVKHTQAITLTQRNGSELSIKPDLSFDHGQVAVVHSVKNSKVDPSTKHTNLNLRKPSQARNDSHLNTLPPIVTEPDVLHKDTQTTKAQNTSPVLPEFKFTQKQNVPNCYLVLEDMNDNKSKHWLSKSPKYKHWHNKSQINTKSNNFSLKKEEHRNNVRLKHHSSISNQMENTVMRGKKVTSVAPIETYNFQLNDLAKGDKSVIDKLKEITSTIDDKEAQPLRIIKGGKHGYVPKSEIESLRWKGIDIISQLNQSILTPVLHQKGLSSYLFPNQTPIKAKANKVEPPSPGINLHGEKFKIKKLA